MSDAKRIRCVYRDEDEPELYGMLGESSMRPFPDGRINVWFDNDKFPTRMLPEDVVVIE